MKMNDRWWHFNYKERNDDGTKTHYELSAMKQPSRIDLLLTNRGVEASQQTVISLPPSKAPTSAIKALKGRSAFIFLRRHPEIRQSQDWCGHLWSPSYYMSTLGNMSKEVVEQYINDQKYNETKKRPNGR